MTFALNDSPHIIFRAVDHPIEVWTQVHGWIDRALDQEHSLITAADAFESLLRKRMKLWVIYSHGVPTGAFITQIETGTRGRALNVIALGGEGMDDWIESWSEAMTIYGRECQCRYIFEMGRRGWVRVMDRYGWVDGPATMIKVL